MSIREPFKQDLLSASQEKLQMCINLQQWLPGVGDSGLLYDCSSLRASASLEESGMQQ